MRTALLWQTKTMLLNAGAGPPTKPLSANPSELLLLWLFASRLHQEHMERF